MRNISRIRPVLVLVAALFCGFVLLTGAGNAQDVVASHGMVASAHPLASRAGLEILQQGGNAVDAAVATAFALGVVEPNASGIGGGGFMVIRTADGRTVTIDYREVAPQKATADLYYRTSESFDSLTHHGPMSIGVPGTVAGLTLALEKYGTLPLSRVLQPAIRYAEEGFPVSAKLSDIIMQKYEIIQMFPATAAIYLDNGLPLMAGNVLKNPDLAATYRLLSDSGATAFYRGHLAREIVRQVQALGGILTMADLQQYRALEKTPVQGSYRGYHIVSSAPPTGGGTHLVELLNILEQTNVNSLGHNSADYLHLLAEAMKMVLADKAYNMGDPAFYRVPVEKLTSKAHAESLFTRIDMQHARFDYQPPHWIAPESRNTTHLSVVDSLGNVVALTQSINLWFGSGVVVEGTGILLNNHLRDFDKRPGHPNSIQPGKRPVSSIAPTIVLKGDAPFLTIGTPGGTRIIGALAQILVNIIDFGMGIDQAIEAPRIHAYKKTLHAEGRIPETVLETLKQRGHRVKVHDNYDAYFGGAQGILIDSETGELRGGADSRRDGVAMGY